MRTMNITALLSISLLAPAALVAAEAPALSPAAARELAEMKDFLNTRALPAMAESSSPECAAAFKPQVDECLALLADYEATGNVQHASTPNKLTMLHLACLMQKPELVRTLLAAGADARAAASAESPEDEGDTPLISSVHTAFFGLPEVPAATRIAIIDMLVAAGADVKGKDGGTALLLCGRRLFDGEEEVALHLLKLGANPGGTASRSDLKWMMLLTSGHQRLLEAMLNAGMLPHRGDWSKPDPNSEGEDDLLLELLLYNNDEAASEELVDGVVLLLRLGAEMQRESVNGGWTAADLIHSNPRLLAALQARGISVPRTPRQLRAESLAEDIRELPGYAMPPTETIAPHWEALSRLLLAPARWNFERRSGYDPDRERILRLMTDVDAPRTAAFIMQLPQWQPGHRWTEDETLLFACLLRVKHLNLPPDWLVNQATRLNAEGRQRLAHELIHLLAQHADAAPLVEELCASPHPALASAAWAVRLELAKRAAQPDERQPTEPALYRRLQAIRRAIHCLTAQYPQRPGHFFDFSFNPQSVMYGQVLPGLTSTHPLQVILPVGCWPSERDELLRTLRELKCEDAANFVAELFRLREQLHELEPEAEPEPAASPNEEADFDPDADYEEPDPGEESPDLDRMASIIERLRALGFSPDAQRHAFDIEAALERFMWELWQKNSKKL